MRKLNDLPLWAKMIIAPALMLLAMLAMAWMAAGQSAEQRARLSRLDTVVFERLRNAMTVSEAVTSFRGELYHLMSVAANESDQKRRSDMSDALAAQMSGVEAQLETLDAILDAGTRSRGAAIDQTFAGYKTAALQVADMTKTDAAYGAMMMGDADAQFQKLHQLLQDFVTALQQERAAVAVQMVAAMDRARLSFLALLGGAVAVSAAAVFLMSRLTARPVLTLTRSMAALADGDTAIDVPGRARRDEVGAMARAVQVFKETAIAAAGHTAERERQRVEQQQRVERVGSLAATFDETASSALQTVSEAAGEMRTTASAMAETAEETNRQAGAAVHASERTAANVQTVATAAEELSSTVAEIGRQVAEIDAHRRQGGRGDEPQRCHGAETGGGGAEDRRGRLTDQCDRQSDQSARAQRDDRGGPCRRSWQGNSPSSLPRSSRSPVRPRRQPKTSLPRLRTCRRRLTRRWPPSAPSARQSTK